MTRKYRVTLEDGRALIVNAGDEALAKKQAHHQELTRVRIAERRGLPSGPDPSMAVDVRCLECIATLAPSS